jgi:hypothetical protein
VHLTGHELTLIPSGVAAIAIIGGYLGVRSANRTTLKVAEQERDSKRADELEALKRTTYTRLLSKLNVLMTTSLEANRLMSSESVEASRRKAVAQEQTAAQDDVVDCVTELELLTDNSDLVALARESMRAAFGITQQTVKPYSSAASKLQVSLRSDLRDRELPVLADQEALPQPAEEIP